MPASIYTPELAAEIIERLSSGETLSSMCREAHMPSYRTVGDWRHALPEFDKQYQQAMLDGCHVLLEETLSIADDRSQDYKTDEDGKQVFDSEHVQRSKLRIWTRHELIKRKRPDIFSDKVNVNHGGNVGFSLTIHDKPRDK